MENRMRLSDRLTVGAQPTEGGLRELKEAGFKTVINLRTADEQDQPLSPQDEGAAARELGMEYVNIPVSEKNMGPAQVDDFRSKLGALPSPVFVHCGKGKRAGAFGMMHQAIEAGWSGEQTLQTAEQMGFECDVPELKDFVKTYVDAHRDS